MNPQVAVILNRWIGLCEQYHQSPYPVFVLEDICRGIGSRLPPAAIEQAMAWLEARKDAKDRELVRAEVTCQLDEIRGAW